MDDIDPALEEALALANLLRPPDEPPTPSVPRPEQVEAWIAQRIGGTAAAPPPSGGEEEVDPRHLAWWLLRMAGHTYRHLSSPPPPVDGALLARFEALLAQRPTLDTEHAQLHVDPASSLRRAEAIRARLRPPVAPVVAVGDDDAVTLALALLEVPELVAVDVDPRLLAFLGEAGRELGRPIATYRADVFSEPVPPALRRRCRAVVTDPIRSLEPSLVFLAFAAACLRRDAPAQLHWCDHPDWNLEHDTVLEALEGMGFGRVETLPELHAYPFDPAWLPNAPEVAGVLGTETTWLLSLASLVCGWSHLHVLERSAPGTTQAAGRAT